MHLTCPVCGYDWYGGRPHVCPECGLANTLDLLHGYACGKRPAPFEEPRRSWTWALVWTLPSRLLFDRLVPGFPPRDAKNLWRQVLAIAVIAYTGLAAAVGALGSANGGSLLTAMGRALPASEPATRMHWPSVATVAGAAAWCPAHALSAAVALLVTQRRCRQRLVKVGGVPADDAERVFAYSARGWWCCFSPGTEGRSREWR